MKTPPIAFGRIVNKIIYLIFLSFVIANFSACTPPTPEQLAKEVCECSQKMKKQKNIDNSFDIMDECISLTQSNMSRLRQIEKDKDMTDTEVQAFEARYDKMYNSCE